MGKPSITREEAEGDTFVKTRTNDSLPADEGGDGDGDDQDARSLVEAPASRAKGRDQEEDEGEKSSTETLYATLERVEREMDGLGVGREELGSGEDEDEQIGYNADSKNNLHRDLEGASQETDPRGSEDDIDVYKSEPFNSLLANGARERQDQEEEEGTRTRSRLSHGSVEDSFHLRGSAERQAIRRVDVDPEGGESGISSGSADKLSCILEERGQDSEEG